MSISRGMVLVLPVEADPPDRLTGTVETGDAMDATMIADEDDSDEFHDSLLEALSLPFWWPMLLRLAGLGLAPKLIGLAPAEFNSSLIFCTSVAGGGEGDAE